VRNESIFPHQEKILQAIKAAADMLICARLSNLEGDVAEMCTKATDFNF